MQSEKNIRTLYSKAKQKVHELAKADSFIASAKHRLVTKTVLFHKKNPNELHERAGNILYYDKISINLLRKTDIF